jgi:phosphoglucosamine mutase
MTLKFGTDGIRGPVDTVVTAEACLRIGQAVGIVAKEEGWNTVMIGKDTRVSGYMLESALQAGFIASGINVRLLGPIPTPGVAYLSKSFRDHFGVVISASHNSFEDNGIKIFMPNGEKLSKEIEKKVEKILNSNLDSVNSESIGKASRFDESGARYIEFCKATVPSEISFKNLRIVLDCANGACYKVSPAIFRELGAEVITIGDDPDGYNINDNCGSTHPEVAKQSVLENRADYGIALDGDGDRVVMIDSNGQILDGDDLLYILAFSNPNRLGVWSGVVGTKMSNFGLEDGLKKLGYSFVRADVGDKYVSQQLSKKNWMLGGETSGHIICKDLISTGDGTIAALKVISSLLLLEKNPSEVLKNYTKYPQFNISLEIKNKDLINNRDIQELIKTIESDITVSRILVRPSGTESKIRIMIEAPEINIAEKFAKDIANLIESKQ